MYGLHARTLGVLEGLLTCVPLRDTGRRVPTSLMKMGKGAVTGRGRTGAARGALHRLRVRVNIRTRLRNWPGSRHLGENRYLAWRAKYAQDRSAAPLGPVWQLLGHRAVRVPQERRGLWDYVRELLSYGHRAGPPAEQSADPPIVVCAVYRLRNAIWINHVLRRVGQPADVRLWALDDLAPTLANVTVGKGPGGKFDLLNRCLEARDIHPSSYVFLVDDDFAILDGTLADFVKVMEAASLGIAQPAHGWSSWVSYKVTKRRFLSRVRRTEFIEIGPAFAISPEWRQKVVPFRSDTGMGWSIQVDLYTLIRRGCPVGVIDLWRILHLVPMGGAYNPPEEANRMWRYADEVGVSRRELEDSARTVGRWFRWQAAPPWREGVVLANLSRGDRCPQQIDYFEQ